MLHDMEIKTLERAFAVTINGQLIELPDPNPAFEPKQVRSLYSCTYPDITNARIDGPFVENDKMLYKFVHTLGTKG
jgi:PRTRC genetic system protein C